MTIKEIRDLFYARYSFECMTRKIDKIEIPDKMISFYISAAQQDIQRRLQVVESSVDVTLGTDSNLYVLPQTFGRAKHAYIGSTPLKEKPITWVEKQSVQGTSGDWFAIKITGHTPYVYCPVTSGTLTIIYYPDLGYYQPSVSATQTWGTFNGVVYSGTLILPDRYNMAILYWMLSQIFSEYYTLYEKEVRSLRESSQESKEETLNYNFGGLDTETIEGVSAGSSILSSPGGSVTIITSLDAPLKRVRMRVADTGTATVEFSNGWESTPTITNNVDSIVISSANNEFTNYIKVDCTNDNFGWVQSGAGTVTFTTDPSSGWGEAEIIIEIYE